MKIVIVIMRTQVKCVAQKCQGVTKIASEAMKCCCSSFVIYAVIFVGSEVSLFHFGGCKNVIISVGVNVVQDVVREGMGT